MFPLTLTDLSITMAASLFLMGALAIAAGVFVLVSKSMGEDVQTIARQTARLAQKGIAEDLSGLVGNASSLVNELNGLVRTSSGIGIFLVLVGFVLIGGAYGLVVLGR